MQEQRFWEIVERSRQGSGGSIEAQSEALAGILGQLATEELVGFDACFARVLAGLYTWRHWGAAHVALGGCGDEAFECLRSWVVGQGLEAYEAFARDPDSLAEALVDEEEVAASGFYSHVAGDLFTQRTDRFLFSAVPGHPSKTVAEDPDGEPFPDDDEELARLYPRLTAVHGPVGIADTGLH